MTILLAVVCGVVGLAVGSLLSVVVRRVPQAAPSTAAPSMMSDARVVEILTGGLFAAIGARFADAWVLPAYLAFTAGLIALSLIDLEHYLLPNRVLYPTGFIAIPLLFVGALLDGDASAFGRALLAGAAAFGMFFVLHRIASRGLGFGDVRLSFLLGCFLGYLSWWHVFFGIFAGFASGAVVGVALVALGRRGRKQHIPFGPFLAAGALTIVLVGQPLIDAYRSV